MRSGCKTITCIFYGCLLTGTCSILPAALQTSLRPHSHTSLQSAAPHTQSSLHMPLLDRAIHPIAHHPHSPLHTALPILQSQSLLPKIPYFQHRGTQRPHHFVIARRGKRQSPAASLLFPAALEGAAPPSQYPWAILWGPTVSDEDGTALSSASSTPRPGFYHDGDHQLHEEPARGLDLRGVPTTLRPHIYSPKDEGTDPQLYVTIVISVLIVLVASGIIIKFCCERRQRRRHQRAERCPLPEEGSLQPLTDLSPDTDIPGLQPLKLGDFKSGNEERGGPYRASKIPMVTM
ncbi:PILR alpha-associated neural protein [Pelobates fuscus]|uniref:PILR alpha-associated neural protein n=1 Tax=Pelobates fuscus TaxID=191477 RepID=UPI002FE4DC18